uniref:Uncharacterized protein n=1 Tax=Panagrolaimus sp. JU765 TaxID=591449 RepID=A0AC34R3N0_9BILA
MGDVCVAAYSIGLFSIRYQTITSRPISLSLPDRHEYRGRPNPKLYHFRGTECFKLLPKKPKVLVITNSNMTEIPIVRLLVEEARKIAEKVVVINGTVARLMYGLNSIDKEVIRIYGRILVAWLLPEYVEYIILQREPDNFRPKFREFGDDQDFYRIFHHQRPDYVLILYRKNNQERAFDLADGLP